MKKFLIILACVLAAVLSVVAQDAPVLKFRNDGKFKIVQFTDIHYVVGKGGSKAALENMNAVLDYENPDFVIITGDLVYGKGVKQAFDELTQPIIGRNIPFAAVFGNHDEQFELTHHEMYDILQAYPGSVMPLRDAVESPDYTIEVLSADSTRTAAVFYCIDSHSVSRTPGTGKYAWIKHDQTGWYRNTSDSLTAKNGGTPIPALAFFHIPLPEFDYAESDMNNALIGTKGEAICCPKLNSGLFTSFKEKGDVYGVFCGHDHDNDFATSYFDVLLAYGRYSGGNTVYNHLKPKGARVIEIKQDSRDIDTWLRHSDGTVTNRAAFPADFNKKRKKK